MRELAGAKNFVVPCTGDVDQEMVPIGPSNPLPMGAAAGIAYTDRSIANASGASQQLMAANSARKALIIQNVAVNPIGVNLAGGAAALNTAGSVTLQPGGSIILDRSPPIGAITVIGTLNDDITALEG